MAPIEANNTVFKISSEFKFGIILKKVPLAVAERVELLTVILLLIASGYLAHGR